MRMSSATIMVNLRSGSDMPEFPRRGPVYLGYFCNNSSGIACKPASSTIIINDVLCQDLDRHNGAHRPERIREPVEVDVK